MANVIEIQGVEKSFVVGLKKKKKVLHSLQLNVPGGAIYGFLGPNGAGKSTTIKLLLNFMNADKGDLKLFGNPITSVDNKKRIGYLSEYPCFYSQITVMETLLFAGRLCGLSADVLRQRAMPLLRRVNLHDAATLRVAACSKGMQQRLGLASALIHDPELLILDEPMSGLDPIGRHLVRELILELRDQGKTIFFSTHILSDIENLCDQVGLVHKGRMLFQGALKEFTKGRPLEEVFLSMVQEQ